MTIPDWVGMPTLYGGLKDLCVISGAAVAAFVGLRGLQTWRRQLRGNSDHELARRMLRLVYQVRDRIAGVRNPFVAPAETAKAMKDAGVPAEEWKQKQLGNESMQFVYQARWALLAAAMSDLHVEYVEAEVLWKDELKDERQQLHECVTKLYMALTRYLRRREGTGDEPEKWGKFENIIFSDLCEDDAFGKDVKKAVTDLEAAIRPYLSPPLKGKKRQS